MVSSSKRNTVKKRMEMQGWIKRVISCGLLTMALGGCAVAELDRGVDVMARGANYTDDYITFEIYSVLDKNFGIGGYPTIFSEGGIGGRICCGLIPKPGGTIRVKWKTDENTFHTKDVVVLGSLSQGTNQYSYLIIRFFPQGEIEAEIIPPELIRVENSRMDRLFFGIKQMRHIGE